MAVGLHGFVYSVRCISLNCCTFHNHHFLLGTIFFMPDALPGNETAELYVLQILLPGIEPDKVIIIDSMAEVQKFLP